MLPATGQAVEQSQTVVEVERGEKGVHVHAQANRREGDIRIDTDNDCGGAAQAGHLGEVVQRAGREGIQHIQRGDVDDDAARAVATNLVDEVALETQQLTVVERYDVSQWLQPISPDAAAVMKGGMLDVAARGTATRLQIPGYEVGGKTGTAQLGTDPPASHTWIIGFAGPPGDPQIAIAVVVLNQPGFGSEATGGRVAAPIPSPSPGLRRRRSGHPRQLSHPRLQLVTVRGRRGPPIITSSGRCWARPGPGRAAH